MNRSPEPAAAELSVRLRPHLGEEALLLLALTHRSRCAEHPSEDSNERLEFLGDAVLGLVVTDALYVRHPGLPEGDLARIRASVVSTESLAPISRALGVGAALRLGRGEERSGGREKASILADTLEALIGAVYLSGGLEAARAFVLELLEARLEQEATRRELGDPKNRLQELLARHGRRPPVYEVAERGPDHAKQFDAVVLVEGEPLGEGAGPSKKAAERSAAAAAIAVISREGVPPVEPGA